MFSFLTKKFSSIFSNFNNKNHLTESNIEQALEQVNEALLEADVPYEVVIQFINQIKQSVLGQKVLKSLNPGQQFIKIVKDKLEEFMGGNEASVSFQIPSIIMVVGLQGSGKTTTSAKIANFLKELANKKGKERNILLSSVDFYRPAAIDQLEVLSKQINAAFYRCKNSNVIKAANEVFEYYKKNQFDYLILDTAGRLHIDNVMLSELREIDIQLTPKYKILVLDSMTGQESLRVAKAFDQAVGFNSAILTKMDSDTRSGAAFAFKYSLKKPILFVGTGEKINDLEQFYPSRMATRILGMGDVLTLIEKAEKNFKQEEQENLMNSLTSGKFTLQDFAKQMEMVNKMGSLSKIAQYLPGVDLPKVSPDMLDKAEKEIQRFKAIISSMTLKERLLPRILDASRKKRIANGSGTSVSDVNLLLEKFEQSKQYGKLFMRQGGFKGLFKKF